MKNSPYLAALMLWMLATHAGAQAVNFEGIDIQLGLGYQSTTGTANLQDPVNGLGTIENARMGSVATSLGLSYTAAISKHISLGAVLETNPLKLKAGSARATPPATYKVSAYDETFKNVNSLSLVPGYAFDYTYLAYAKLGYTSTSALFSSNDGSADSSQRLNGYNLGLGLRVDKGKVYPFAEFNYLRLNSTSNVVSNGTGVMTQGGSAYNLIGGIGYHF